jgi:hypothetical protein
VKVEPALWVDGARGTKATVVIPLSTSAQSSLLSTA